MAANWTAAGEALALKCTEYKGWPPKDNPLLYTVAYTLKIIDKS